MIDELAVEYQVVELCELLGTSRSGYYAWRGGGRGNRKREDTELTHQIRRVHRDNRGAYGSPRITRELQEEGVECGRNRVARLMREDGLQGAQKPRFRPQTTDSSHNGPISPNRLKDAVLERPNQAWVSDITYIPVGTRWVYLVAFMDLVTRTIKGWALRESMSADLVVEALHQAANRYQPEPGLIVHSDRGSQYASDSFRKTLRSLKAMGSMGRTGNCYDNATMESFWATLKRELHIKEPFESIEEARLTIFEYIEGFYNRHRRHSSIGYQAPVDYESKLMAERN